MKLIRRLENEYQIIGSFYTDAGIFLCYTLELPWLNNARNISCILKGIYRVKKRWSAKYGWHFILQDVYGRSLILIHFGNFNSDTKGCILVGKELTDINKDSFLDVTQSKATIAYLLEIMPDEFNLEIL